VPAHRPSATPQAGEQLLKSITSPLSSMAARLFRHSAVVVSSSSEAQAQAGHNIAATYPHPSTPSLPALEHAASPKPSKPLTPTQGLGGLSQLRESLRSTGKQALAAVKAPGRLHLMPRRSSSLQQLVRRGDMAALALELETSPHCLEAKDIDRRTPLHVAAEEGSVQALRLLLVAGADASVRDRRQTDPLFVASGRGHKEVVELLIDMGKAGVNSRCFAARTALHEAAAHGHTSVVQALLQRGADANAVDTQGVSPLMGTSFTMLDCLHGERDVGGTVG
jgi:ankyrin repeat protein